jgi:hypothetical protein
MCAWGRCTFSNPTNTRSKMTFQPAPQIVEVTLNSKQDGVPVVNRWNVDVGHAVTHTDLTGVFAVVDAWVTSTLKTNQVTSMLYETIVVKDMSVANGEELIYIPTTPHGQLAIASLPNSTAVVASLRTANTGKNFRGRSYMGGIPTNAQVDSTHISAAYAAGTVSVMTDLISALSGAGYKLVVLSRWLNKILRVTALATEIISVIVDTTMDNQRRRTAN